MQTILLIGSGRLARHLRHWNSLNKESNQLLFWNRKDNSPALLEEYLKQTSIVWLAISDSSLSSFYEKYLAHSNIQCVHFSGAFFDQRMMSAHPLMSFPTELMADSVYSKIHFVLTGNQNLSHVLPGFENTYSIIKAENKSYYHALCVVSGNFPQLLWSETHEEFKKLQIPDQAFDSYIRQITENFIQLKKNSLTGPLVRKDQGTIEKNLVSLKNSKLKELYQKFIEVFTK